MNKRHLPISVALLLVLLILTPQQSRADQISDLSFDTSALVGGGTFFINFQLTDGDATNNNTASLTDFNFAAGVAGDASTVQMIGGASGSLNAGTVTLSDSGFLNDFLQEFTPGDVLNFRLTLSPPAFSGGTPDQFTFAILDSAFQEVKLRGGMPRAKRRCCA